MERKTLGVIGWVRRSHWLFMRCALVLFIMLSLLLLGNVVLRIVGCRYRDTSVFFSVVVAALCLVFCALAAAFHCCLRRPWCARAGDAVRLALWIALWLTIATVVGFMLCTSFIWNFGGEVAVIEYGGQPAVVVRLGQLAKQHYALFEYRNAIWMGPMINEYYLYIPD